VMALESYFEANHHVTDDIDELLRILRSEINRMSELLKELGSSRVLLDVNLQPTSLAAEIREVLALQSAYHEQRRITVNQHIPCDLPRIIADKDKLRQVLLNLCKNAVEAMPNGGTLTLRSFASGQWVSLDIHDTGDGIPENLSVFEPGVTSKAQSSGVGLTIVREIIRQHAGTVSYTSRLGKGTTFHLKLPIYIGDHQSRVVAEQHGDENPL
jgi:signal transduction histidine kinase